MRISHHFKNPTGSLRLRMPNKPGRAQCTKKGARGYDRKKAKSAWRQYQ